MTDQTLIEGGKSGREVGQLTRTNGGDETCEKRVTLQSGNLSYKESRRQIP